VTASSRASTIRVPYISVFRWTKLQLFFRSSSKCLAVSVAILTTSFDDAGDPASFMTSSAGRTSDPTISVFLRCKLMVYVCLFSIYLRKFVSKRRDHCGGCGNVRQEAFSFVKNCEPLDTFHVFQVFRVRKTRCTKIFSSKVTQPAVILTTSCLSSSSTPLRVLCVGSSRLLIATTLS
jgi:hypothetical protein